METIISGTTTERIVRAALLAVFVNVSAVAFLWDGYVGYAHDNGEELARLLGVDPSVVPEANRELTRERGRTIAEEAKPGTDFVAATSTLGEPTLMHGNGAYYVGPGGWLHVARDGQRVVSAAWIDGKRSESDQQWQRWIGYFLAVLGHIATANLMRVLRARAILSDDGLLLRGRRLIRWDDITDLRTDPSDKDGQVELTFSDGGKPRVLRLNDYVYKALPSIADAIRERKQLGNDAPSQS